MGKHTPGPWRIETATDEYGWVNYAINDGTYYGQEQKEANARLIAAAPEMYKELQNIANADYRQWDEGMNTPEEFVLWAKNRCSSLIARIEGGE